MGNSLQKKIQSINKYLLYIKITYNNNKEIKSNKHKIEFPVKEINLNHSLLYLHEINKDSGILKFSIFFNYQKKTKKLKDKILKLTDLSYNKKHSLILNFSFASELKLNYIISEDKKELESFIKDSKNKRVINKNKVDNIFEFLNSKEENQNNIIFGEIESEEEDESIKSEAENIESEDDDDYFFLKAIPRTLLKRSKSQYYKPIKLKEKNFISNHNNNNNNISNNNINNKKEQNNIKIGERLNNNINNNNINLIRLNTVIVKGRNNNYNNIYNFRNKIKPKEIILNNSEIDFSKEENENLNSFCKGFFIVSFPYNNGKIIENSKIYRSICGHLLCSKLPAMESVIIYKYPLKDSKDLELNNFCASICFPTGIKVCYNQERRSTYKSFCTNIVNHKGEKYYMTVFHFYHKMDTLTYNKKYTENPLKNYLRKFGDNIYSTKEEKEKLEKDLEECQELGFKEFVYIPYAIALISKYPYINQMKEALNNVFRIYTNYQNIFNNNSIENSIINDLIVYLNNSIPIPIPNSYIVFNLPFSNNKIEIENPYNNSLGNLNEYNYGNLLNYFSVENIITIYRLMLFEQKILFVDKDYDRLSSVIQSFIELLYPIEWVNTLIPVMSEQMTRYLQTFLPFINGISEDLLKNNALNALEEAEEGVYEIFIMKDNIQISKNNSEDNEYKMPKLPKKIYKKIYNELKSIKDIYNELDINNKNIYAENINNIIKNIFLESCGIMLYDFMDYIFNIKSNCTIYNFDMLIQKKNKEDFEFYKELSDTQIFQNFIQNIISNKNNYNLFISTLNNIQEKYIIHNDKKNGIKWKNSIERKVKLKDIQTKSLLFNLPNHLINSSLDNTIKNIFIINNDSWSKLKYNNNCANEIISESNRTVDNITIINEKLYKSIKRIERYIIPKDIEESRIKIYNKDEFGNPIKAKYIKNISNINNLRSEFDLNEEDKKSIKDIFEKILLSLFKNESNICIDKCLTYVYYNTGREILSKLMYKKGFRVVKKIKEECFISLAKICLNGLISICNINESDETIDFAVKITQAAFTYSKENEENLLLIDELRSKLGKDYFMWIKQSFWNTWQNLENYFSINDYDSYCDIIKFDFSFKMLRLKIDKVFIFDYLKNSLEEKMNLLLETQSSNNNKEGEDLFNKFNEKYSNSKKDLIEIINFYNY